LCQTQDTVRVVLDTNILLSACWTPSGLEAETVQLALAGTITACVSAVVWAEYQDVLFRPKFAGLRGRAEDLLARLEMRTFSVEPTERIGIASDEDDNRFLECATAAQAVYLITGNLKHYPRSCGAVTVVNAREFLNFSPE
jgi:putative PIN family toxin of toxin-antitoxin system